MAKTSTISEARRRLFDLVDWVLDNPEGVVYIQHRDRAARVALVREDRLAYLERRDRQAGSAPSLVGSVRLPAKATVDDVVAEVRADESRRAARRLTDLPGG